MSLPLLGAGMATDGFSPSSISGLQFWVDAADSATLYTDSTLTTLAVADGDVIGGWKDKSGNSRNALQTDGTKKPLLKLAIQNGRNCVRYDGVNDFLSAISFTLSGDFTLFFVAKPTTDTFSCLAGTQAAVAYGSYLGWVGGTDYRMQTQVGFLVPSPLAAPAINTCKISRFRRESTTGYMHIDAALYASGSMSPADAGDFSVIGSRQSTTTAYFTGDFSEIIYYGSSFSSGDIALVEAYLKAKWGTP
jgi:hypothetical protein